MSQHQNIFPGKYYFTRDIRVKTGRMLNFCQDELVQLAENMIMPIFIVKAKNASYYEPKKLTINYWIFWKELVQIVIFTMLKQPTMFIWITLKIFWIYWTILLNDIRNHFLQPNKDKTKILHIKRMCFKQIVFNLILKK